MTWTHVLTILFTSQLLEFMNWHEILRVRETSVIWFWVQMNYNNISKEIKKRLKILLCLDFIQQEI